MKAFGDAVYFIALLSTRDRWHTRAIAINRQPPGLLVTTEWVLTEVGDAFSQPGARQQFIRLLDLLRQQPDVEIVPSTSDLFRRGTDFFSARLDKEWSLTDCISFVVMNELGITDFPDKRSPFRAGRVSSSSEGLRTRVFWHATQDQPKWAHEWEYMSAYPRKTRGTAHLATLTLKIQGRSSVDAGWTCYKLCYNFGALAAAR